VWELLHLLREDDVRQKIIYGTLSVAERRDYLLDALEAVFEINTNQLAES
jgi:hypothetical protein